MGKGEHLERMMWQNLDSSAEETEMRALYPALSLHKFQVSQSPKDGLKLTEERVGCAHRHTGIDKDPSRTGKLPKEDICIIWKHFKKCSTVSAIVKMYIKITLRSHLVPV